MLRSRILVTEKVDRLIFENAGCFFDGKPDGLSEKIWISQ